MMPIVPALASDPHGPASGQRRGVAGHRGLSARVLLGRGLVPSSRVEAARRARPTASAAGAPAGSRVHADGLDHAVHTDAAGHLAYHVDRLLGVEVDDLRALAARHVEPVGHAVNDDDAPGALEAGAPMTATGRRGPRRRRPRCRRSPISASPAPNQAVGKMSESRIAWSSVTSSGSRTRPTCAKGTRACSACSPSSPPAASGPPKNTCPPPNPAGWRCRTARKTRLSCSKRYLLAGGRGAAGVSARTSRPPGPRRAARAAGRSCPAGAPRTRSPAVKTVQRSAQRARGEQRAAGDRRRPRAPPRAISSARRRRSAPWRRGRAA